MIRFNDIEIDRKTKSISRNGVRVFWGDQCAPSRTCGVSFRIAQHLLLSGGMSLGEMFDRVYEDHDEGGPLTGPKQVAVMMCQSVGPRLQGMGLEIRSEKIAGITYYRAVDVA